MRVPCMMIIARGPSRRLLFMGVNEASLKRGLRCPPAGGPWVARRQVMPRGWCSGRGSTDSNFLSKSIQKATNFRIPGDIQLLPFRVLPEGSSEPILY